MSEIDFNYNDLLKSVSPYLGSSLAASTAAVPLFKEVAAKSALQRGLGIPMMTALDRLKGGLKVAPTVGVIVGVQMGLNKIVEDKLLNKSQKDTVAGKMVSSSIVGLASAPMLAVLNGQSMGRSPLESLRNFKPKLAGAIAVQETTFVLGLSSADLLSSKMKKLFGDNAITDYSASFIAGSLGSLAGHPANTALTRWQSGLTIDNPKQLLWGSARKARAVGIFSVIYKFGKSHINERLDNLTK